MDANLEHIIRIRDQFYNIFVLNKVRPPHANSNNEIITKTCVDDSNNLGLDYESEYIEDETDLIYPITG